MDDSRSLIAFEVEGGITVRGRERGGSGVDVILLFGVCRQMGSIAMSVIVFEVKGRIAAVLMMMSLSSLVAAEGWGLQ